MTAKLLNAHTVVFQDMVLIATASLENPHVQPSITRVDAATVNITLITCVGVKTK